MIEKALYATKHITLCAILFFNSQHAFAENANDVDFSHVVINQLKKKLETDPNNAGLYFQLAKEHFSYEEKKAGLDALNQAIKLDPRKHEYYFELSRFYAQSDKPTEAYAAITQATKLEPAKSLYWRNRGIIADWVGKDEDAVNSFTTALKLDPADQESIQGLKDIHARKAKPTKAADKKKSESTTLVHNQKPPKPERPKTTVIKNTPTPPEPKPLRSLMTIGQNSYQDTHTVDILDTNLFGYVFINPHFSLHFAGLYEYASATDDEYTIHGFDHISNTSGKIGILYHADPYFNLEANVGALVIEDRGNFGIYDITAKAVPCEEFWFNYRFSHDLFRPDYITVASPRSIALEILENDNFLHVHAEAQHRFFLDINGEYNQLSDANVLRHLTILPSMKVYEIPCLVVNLGLNTDWYSFIRRLPNNGYYSPRLSQLYFGTLSVYHPFSEFSAISLNLGAGLQKDECFEEFHFGSDCSVSALVKILQDCQLDFFAGFSSRGSPEGSYQVWTGRVAFTKRF